MADTTEQELRDTLATLTEKIAILETRIAALEARQEIPESDLIAIGAAVAAYFGLKAKVRAVRFGSQTRWAAAARGRVHDRYVPHVR